VIVGLEKQIARHEDERDDLNSTIDSLKREVKKLKDSSKSRSAEVESYSTKPQTSGNGTIAHSVVKFDATALRYFTLQSHFLSFFINISGIFSHHILAQTWTTSCSNCR
jgi:hypothetical protein